MVQQGKKDYDELITIVLIGAQGTGKTQILNRYANGTFEDNYKPTNGVDFTRRI